MTTSLHGRLLCASNWAYAVDADGSVRAAPPYDTAVGFVAAPQGFVSGKDERDACLVGRNGDGIVVAFRGTLPPDSPNRRQALEDWLQDFDAGLVSRAGMPGQVHEGFARTVDTLWPELSAAVKALRAARPDRVFVTGHSKGGAVAPLAAMRLLAEGIVTKAEIEVCTFAGAHAGNQAFADGYLQAVSSAVRYEFGDDIVPHVPPSFVFRHALSKIEALRGAVGVGYAPAGELRFIDWGGRIVGGSAMLHLKRLWHLVRCVGRLEFEQIVRAHSIECGSGYMSAVCPAGVCG